MNFWKLSRERIWTDAVDGTPLHPGGRGRVGPLWHARKRQRHVFADPQLFELPPRGPVYGLDSLVEAATFVQTVEQRQGIKISAPEEIAYKYGWITKEKLLESAARYGKSPYGQHLMHVAEGKIRY